MFEDILNQIESLDKQYLFYNISCFRMVWARLGAVDVAPDSSSEGCWIPTGDTNWEKYAQNII